MIGAKVRVARLAGTASRVLGRGSGTSVPGRVLLAIAPNAIEQLARRLEHGSVVVSATNGKTTTSALLAAILQAQDERVVHNVQGANMAGGVATALMDATGRRSAQAPQIGLFEVDEFWLDGIAPSLQPRVLVLGNLFRDQLDRYGELETIGDRWAAMLPTLPGTVLALNADDPLVAQLGDDRENVVFFGIEDDTVTLDALPHASDSTHCRRCGTALIYDAVYFGHLGRYHCPHCDLRRPEPSVTGSSITLNGTRGSTFTLQTPAGPADVAIALPGLYNVYNAVAAAAAATALGIGLHTIVKGLGNAGAAFGRAETVHLGGRDISILLIKNPTGANEVIRTLALEPEPIDLLAVLNDNIADGRDVSWIWDADLELLADSMRTLTCSGSRASELALRCKYAGVPVDRITVVDAIEPALDHAVRGAAGPLHVMPTYTAMLALREILHQRGATSGVFS